ncbi:MAG: hypothetical protein ABIO55_07970, partial [Ginsengibacter sp.]
MEAECTRNIELWWLLHQLMPGYHTIADFRKDNAVAFKKAFKIFVSFLKGEDMLSAEMIAIDGTKIRAQNNKKNNFNEAGLAKHVAYIENKTQEYLALLDEYDAIEDKQAKALKQQEVIQKIAILKERKQKYEQFTEILNNSDDKQISTTDPQSRSLPVKEGITNVCYNIQTVADSKHSLIVEFETINEGDQGQLSNMACKAKQILEVEQITALADKGYHTGKQLQECRQEHITTIVAYPDRSSRAAQKQTESGLPAQNFAVIALQKRVFSRSNIRVMFVNKQSINYDHTKDTTRPLYSQYNRNLGLEYNLASSTNKWTGKAMLVKSFSPG